MSDNLEHIDPVSVLVDSFFLFVKGSLQLRPYILAVLVTAWLIYKLIPQDWERRARLHRLSNIPVLSAGTEEEVVFIKETCHSQTDRLSLVQALSNGNIAKFRRNRTDSSLSRETSDLVTDGPQDDAEAYFSQHSRLFAKSEADLLKEEDFHGVFATTSSFELHYGEHANQANVRLKATPERDKPHRLSSRRKRCSCRRKIKAASWNEADAHKSRKEELEGKANTAPSVSYFCGKLIQVSNSSQVQIGDQNTIQNTGVPGECGEEDRLTTADVGTDTLSIIDTTPSSDDYSGDDEDEDGLGPICSECRARMTDDEKSKLPLVSPTSSTSTSPLTSPNSPGPNSPGLNSTGPNSPIDLSPSHSYSPLSDTPYSTDDELSPTRKSRTGSSDVDSFGFTDEEKRRMLKQGEKKLYLAAKENRERKQGVTQFGREEDRKSLRHLIKRRKTPPATKVNKVVTQV